MQNTKGPAEAEPKKSSAKTQTTIEWIAALASLTRNDIL